MASLNVSALWPVYMANTWISGCLLNLLDEFASDPEISARAFVPCSDDDCVRPHIHRCFHPKIYHILSAMRVNGSLDLLAQVQFLRDLDSHTIAWLWGSERPSTQRSARGKAQLVIRECVNTSNAHSRRVLDAAAKQQDIAPTHGIEEADINREREAFSLADFAFACSPAVARSLEEDRLIAPDRILQSTYAWDEKTFRVPERTTYDSDDPLFIFVGFDGLRKGLLELLDAWRLIQPKARLRIVGGVPEPIAGRMGAVLARPEVTVRQSEQDLVPTYRDADVFVLPSHEEGSPLVTYMAMAAGLPSLTSPAGAGGIIEDNVHGLVRNPLDRDALCDGLSQLAKDAGLRERLGRAARLRSRDYTWSAVAQRRRSLLQKVIG